MNHPLVLLAVFPAAAYVVGATPFGFLIARLRGTDIRKHGSGNVGATNVGRVLGKKWGYLCFLLDVAKGLLPTLTVVLLTRGEGRPGLLTQAAWLATGAGAILGHVFSFWLRFRGGKGVATSLGVVVGIFPYFTWAGLCALCVWIAVTLISRYVSLGSIVAALAFVPLLVGFTWGAYGLPPGEVWPLIVFSAVMAALIVLRHRANIRRLLDGTENTIDARKKAKEQVKSPQPQTQAKD